MQNPRGLPELLTGRRRFLWIGLAALVLVTFFIILRFPYHRLAQYVAVALQRETGVVVSFQDFGPALHLQGPGFRANGVRIASGEEMLLVDAASVRPAWSSSWLLGRPALYIELEGAAGIVAGTLTTGSEADVAGMLQDVDVAALPLSAFGTGFEVDGLGDIEIDLKNGSEGPEGWVRFEIAEGSLALADFPMAIPFDRLTGSVTFGGDPFATIDTFDLDGPLLKAQITGSIGRAPEPAMAPLDLQIQIVAKSAIQPALASAGVRLGSEGGARIRISGTAAEPLVR